MKTRNYVIAIASLILVSMMVWFSCEKEDILPIHSTTENITLETMDISPEVAAYLTKSEINAFYQEVEAAKEVLSPTYMLRMVEVVMENEVEYLHQVQNVGEQPFQSPAEIKYTGAGIWEGFGRIKYAETVNLPAVKGKPVGEGTIFLMRSVDRSDVIIASPLDFESWDRTERKYPVDKYPAEVSQEYNDSDANKLQEKRVSSLLKLTGGDGIFDGAYGTAHKLEIHSGDRPNYCKDIIYGYVFIKIKEA